MRASQFFFRGVRFGLLLSEASTGSEDGFAPSLPLPNGSAFRLPSFDRSSLGFRSKSGSLSSKRFTSPSNTKARIVTTPLNVTFTITSVGNRIARQSTLSVLFTKSLIILPYSTSAGFAPSVQILSKSSLSRVAIRHRAIAENALPVFSNI